MGRLKSVEMERDLVTELPERGSASQGPLFPRDRYPLNVPALRGFKRLDFHPRVTFIIGENGSGKSTLLEGLAVAMGINPEGGSRNFRFSTRDSHSMLGDCLRLAWGAGKGEGRQGDMFFLRAESMYNVASEIDRIADGIHGSYGGKSLHEMSHGESFLALLVHRFRGNGVYLLDEPEAALSPQRQLAALRRLHDLTREGAQFVISTHSPILMAYPEAWIYACTDEGLRRVEYEDTEHFSVTRAFMLRREEMLKELLEG